MFSDPKTTIVGGICLLAFLILTLALLMKAIDTSGYAVALSAVSTFGVGLVGLFAPDAHSHTLAP